MIRPEEDAVNGPEPEITAALDACLLCEESAGPQAFARHLLIEVRAPKAQPRVPGDASADRGLNLGVVLDASGSMSGARLHAAVEATAQLLEQLRATEHFSLVSFASDVEVHACHARLDTASRSAIGLELRKLSTRGSTDLAGGWLAGCECVAMRMAAREAGSGELDHVFLLSDGHANAGMVEPHRLAEYANGLRLRGISTSTIGIGAEYSPVQLQAIAEAGGGRMHDAEAPEEIAGIMLAELGDTRSMLLRDVEVELDEAAALEFEVLGAAREIREGGRTRFLLGSMLASASRQLVLRIRTHRDTTGRTGPEGAIRLGLRVRWRHAADEALRTRELRGLELRMSTRAACKDEPRDPTIAGSVARQWQNWAVRRAMQINQHNGPWRAAQFVQSELRALMEYARDLPGARELVGTLSRYSLEVERPVEARNAKEVLLATHKFARGEVDHRRERDDAARKAAKGFLPPQA